MSDVRCRLISAAVSILTLVGLAPAACAIDVSGDQSGTWTLENSPYRMVGDVRVPPGQRLIIEPGVEVLGLAGIKLIVEQSTLLAVGTADQPITFTAANPNAPWRGIRMTAANDATMLSYCVLEHARGDGAYPDVRGGAVYVVECSPTFTHNVFRGNYSRNGNANGCGGGICTQTSDAVITDNTFISNQSDSGGAIAVTEYGSPHIARNLIAGNAVTYAGGGIYCGARSSPLIENNLIAGNTSGGWGGGGINAWTVHALGGRRATVRNNLIVNNVASDAGGGLYCRYGNTQMSGNTFVGNRAGRGGAIYAVNQGSSEPDVFSSILWGNTAPQGSQIYLEPSTGSTIVVGYSDVQGGWQGTGNLDTDPLFRDADGPDNNPATWEDNDYHLTGGSDCTDAGDPSYVPDPQERDLDGDPRIINDRIDVGVDESTGGVPCEAVKRLTARCTGGKLAAKVVMRSRQFDGETVTINVSGDEIFLVIRGRKARVKIKRLGGVQTVTLVNPADCVDPVEVDCG